MNAACRRRGCPRKVQAQGYCKPHYTKLRAAGKLIGGYVDPEPIRARIEAHLARGENLCHLATLAGWDRTGLHNILHGRNKAVRVHAARRLMAVPLPPTHIGTLRRLQALARLGHRRSDIADAAGVSEGALDWAKTEDRYHVRLRLKIHATYRTLSGRPGTSPLVARRADSKAWAPPLAWHDVDIDDPAAVPDLGVPTRVTAADTIAEVERLVGMGESLFMACKAVGIKPATLASSRWRAVSKGVAA